MQRCCRCQRCGLHQWAAVRLCDKRWRRRQPSVGRAEAAHRHRARPPPQPHRAAPRRGECACERGDRRASYLLCAHLLVSPPPPIINTPTGDGCAGHAVRGRRAGGTGPPRQGAADARPGEGGAWTGACFCMVPACPGSPPSFPPFPSPPVPSASQKRTTIIIAHRLSTIRDADRICVLDKGVLVEQVRGGEGGVMGSSR